MAVAKYTSRWSLKDDKFKFAVSNLPLIDNAEILEKLSKHNPLNLTVADVNQRSVALRYMNPVCDMCWKNDPKTIRNLTRCTQCYLAAYCSKACQLKAWPEHKKRCGEVNGPADEGPQKQVFLKVCNKCNKRGVSEGTETCRECRS